MFKPTHLSSLAIVMMILGCGLSVEAASGYCSLERMKKFAMEACEHLFMHEELREKRSPTYDNNLIEDSEHVKFSDHHRHHIARAIYPVGGYLKVGREHFHKLSQVDVHPKYKPIKLHHEKRTTRYKREPSTPLYYNNIPYCCYNRCGEDFFC